MIGGCQRLFIQEILQGSRSGKPLLLIGDLSGDTQYWAEPHRVPPQGGPLNIWYEAVAKRNGEVVIPTFGGVN